MKIRSYILALLILTSNLVYGHQDFWMVKTFSKVKVRIQTGFHYEEINKAWLIGEYANILIKELKYNDTLFLDFNHAYTGDCVPDYFIAYDDGAIKQTYLGGETYRFLKVKALVIREVSRQFNIATTLKLVEYAITNLASIKLHQKNVDYNKNYCQWLINSIDTSIIRRKTRDLIPASVNQVLKQRLSRPKTENEDNCTISYFVKDNKYHIYFNSDKTKKDTVLLVLDNIYQFERISYDEAIVFTNDNTFYYFESYYPKTSKKLFIQNNNSYYRPYEILKIAPYKVTISFNVYNKNSRRQPQYRTLLYRCDIENLTQDIDEAIDK